MKKTIYTFFFIFVLALSSCYRDNLCFYHPEGAVIELNVDWSKAQLEPNSATAVIFKDGQFFRTEVISAYPPVHKEIFLPVGKYSFILFNEQKSDYERTLSFVGMNSFSSFEGRTIDDYMSNLLARSLTRSLKSEVDTLAVDRVIDFEITPDMIPESHVDPTPLGGSSSGHSVYSVDFIPERAFTIVDILLKVKNGKGYFFTQKKPAELRGTVESYFLGSDQYSSSTVSHPVKFIQLPATTPDSVSFRASLQVVGFRDMIDPLLIPGSLEYRINLPFTYSGGISIRDFDLRGQAKKFIYSPRYTENRPQHHLYVELELELDPLVDVGGMNATVEDWNEVDIPLDGPQRLHFLANNGSSEAAWWPCIPGVEINLLAPFFITPVPNLSFREWNSLPDGSGTSYQPGDQYLMKRGGAIFYAIWDRTDLPERTLYFVANDGTNNIISAKRKPGLLIPIPANMFTPQLGKRFKEWNSNAAGTGKQYLPDQPFRVLDEDTRFYAIWE